MNDFSHPHESSDQSIVQVLLDIVGCYGTPTYAFDIQRFRIQVEKLQRELPAAEERKGLTLRSSAAEQRQHAARGASPGILGIDQTVASEGNAVKHIEPIAPVVVFGFF